MKIPLIKWTLAGLLIRVLIMPFSFHGHDIFFIYYFPFKLISAGVWDPYLWMKINHPHIANPPYPPILFLMFSGFLFLLKPLLPHLNHLFSTFESWNFTWEGNTIHYASLLADHELLRTLFVFKIPLLFFDFAIARLLYLFFQSDKKKGLLAYKIWMFNPFVLHSCYAIGQVDIVYTFFIMAAIYCVHLHKPYGALGLLTLGALMKTFPLILIPIAVVLIGETFRDKLKLSLWVASILMTIMVPFYLSSNTEMIKAIFFSPSAISPVRSVAFMGSYAIILFLFFFINRKTKPTIDHLSFGFAIPLLLFFSLYAVTLRFFIIITPLLIYIAVKNKRFWTYNLLFIITLFELRTSGNSQQWGLFAALHPEFFSSLPITDSYLNLITNVKIIHQGMYRLFSSVGLIAAGDMLIRLIKNNFFKFPLKNLSNYEKG